MTTSTPDLARRDTAIESTNRPTHQIVPCLARNAPVDALVLDGGVRQTLSLVRSLGRRGHHVAVLHTNDKAPTFASRWCEQRFICPVEEGSAAYIDAVEQAIEQCGTPVVIPTSDASIATLREHRERIESRVRLALAKESALAIAVSKERTLELARQVGLAVPQSVALTDVGQLEDALATVGLPLVVKPVESWVGGAEKGARLVSELVTTRAEAYAVVRRLLAYPGSSVLLQQFIVGERESMHIMYANGRVYAKFAHAITRTNPPLGGVDVIRHSIAVPADIGEQAERLIRAMDLEGYSLIEFRRDAAGRPYLMEVNPRLGAGVALATLAGVDFPYLVYQWASGQDIDIVENYRLNCRMRYLAGDILMTAVCVLKSGKPGMATPLQAVLDFCGSFFVPMHYDYVDWRDPGPMARATVVWAREFPMWIKRAVPGSEPSHGH